MQWFKSSFRNGLHSIFSTSPGNAEPPTEIVPIDIEDVREEMLRLLDDVRSDPRTSTLMRRVTYASDVQALWFLRGDLMSVLANAHGEPEARLRIASVSAHFGGLLPEGLRSRPSPLATD